MWALASGVPLVHHEWVDKCIAEGRVVDYSGGGSAGQESQQQSPEPDNGRWDLPSGISLLEGGFIFRPAAPARGLLQGAYVWWMGGVNKIIQ